MVGLIKFNLHDSLRFGFNLEFLVKSSFMLPFIHITLGLLNGDNNIYRNISFHISFNLSSNVFIKSVNYLNHEQILFWYQ